jgi:hypothetical protein
VKKGFKAARFHSLIIPEFDGIDIRMIEVLPVDRWAQDDINATPVCFPSWLVRPPAEQSVRNGQPTVVFLPEFIPGSSGGGIPVSPEFPDEEVSLSVILELFEGRLFFGSDDVENVLLEPIFVFLREFGLIFSPKEDRKTKRQTKKNGENKPSCSHGNTQF